LLHIRERIAEECAIESPLSGEVEVDESFFGARYRAPGQRPEEWGKTLTCPQKVKDIAIRLRAICLHGEWPGKVGGQREFQQDFNIRLIWFRFLW